MKQITAVIQADPEYPLEGILTLPDHAEGRIPAVVFVHGSGSSDRDEHVFGLYPFRDLAEGLAAYGIASLRYDKRSFIHARKMLKNGNITVRTETIDDALSAADLLRHTVQIDENNIFLLGHSLGASLAPRIDAEGGSFKGLILMAGTPYRLEELMMRQIRQQIEGSGKIMRKFLTSYMERLKNDIAGLYEMSDEEAKNRKFSGGTTLYYLKEMGEHAPADYLNASDKPVLIMQGGKDFQVSADTDYAAWQGMLKERENTTFRLYPELNHCFVPSVFNDIMKVKEEYSVEQHIPNEVIGNISEWILEHV